MRKLNEYWISKFSMKMPCRYVPGTAVENETENEPTTTTHCCVATVCCVVVGEPRKDLLSAMAKKIA